MRAEKGEVSVDRRMLVPSRGGWYQHDTWRTGEDKAEAKKRVCGKATGTQGV